MVYRAAVQEEHLEQNEKVLVDKAKSGDIQAFEQLISGCQKKVFNIAFRMTGNYDDAADLAQEAFLKMFKSIRDFKGHSSLSTWIYRITVNLCLDHIRKAKKGKFVYIDNDIRTDEGDIQRELEYDGPGPEDEMERSEIRQAVADALSKLPEDQKIILILRDIQYFSYEEIAGILKLPEGTVKSRLNRARSALRDILRTKKELWDTDYVKYTGKEGLA